jgi:transcription antitermination factor NusG
MNNQTTNIPTQNSKLKTQNSVWYALYTKPRWEKKVAAVLSAAGYKVFLPLISTIRQWSDRKKKVQVPLINSYVFVQVEEKELYELLKFDGVVRILKFLKKPAKVLDKEIENLKIISQHPDKLVLGEKPVVEKGSSVQIVRGAMCGLYGECVKINGKHRVQVSVKNLGLTFVLNVPLTYIEVVKSSPEMSC